MVEFYLKLKLILRIISYLTYICWETDNFVIKSDIFRRFFICKNILKKLSCYHDNNFRYFVFGKYNGFVSKARVSACMYFLVYSYIQYCIIVWGPTYQTNLNRIVLLQKRVIRVVNKDKFDAHTEPIFNELKILTVEKIYKYHLGQFMYLYQNNLLPKVFDGFFYSFRSCS